MERLVSCQCQRQQTQSRVEQLMQQTAALPRHFPWPGFGDRRHAVEQATALLDKTRSLSPTLSALRALGREMSQLTRDPSWTDPSWQTIEECVPGLIKDLTVSFVKRLVDCVCVVENNLLFGFFVRTGIVRAPRGGHPHRKKLRSAGGAAQCRTGLAERANQRFWRPAQ